MVVAAAPADRRRANRALGEQIRARLGELHEGAALVQLEPTLLDRAVETSLVLRWSALKLKQKRAVDFFDVDPAILDRLKGVGELDELAGGRLWIGERSNIDEFHQASPFIVRSTKCPQEGVSPAFGAREPPATASRVGSHIFEPAPEDGVW
jgi:hypothetical protein